MFNLAWHRTSIIFNSSCFFLLFLIQYNMLYTNDTHSLQVKNCKADRRRHRLQKELEYQNTKVALRVLDVGPDPNPTTLLQSSSALPFTWQRTLPLGNLNSSSAWTRGNGKHRFWCVLQTSLKLLLHVQKDEASRSKDLLQLEKKLHNPSANVCALPPGELPKFTFRKR